MNYALSIWAEALILVIALSLDSFVASFAYGTNRVKIPVPSMLIITGICSGTLILFLFLGSFFHPLLPESAIAGISFAILFLLGIVKLCDSSIKSLLKKNKMKSANVHFSFSSLKFILTVYADPDKANADNSNVLSPAESISLAIAMSLDSAVVGFGAGMGNVYLLPVLLLSLITGAASIFLGRLLGTKLAEKVNLDLSWLSGVLLIVLAFLKFF